jgi:hypothetical protein
VKALRERNAPPAMRAGGARHPARTLADVGTPPPFISNPKSIRAALALLTFRSEFAGRIGSMIEGQKPFEEGSFKERMESSCLLALPTMSPRKMIGEPCIGKAWPKKAKNGRLYYKLKFDCFARRGGKTFYARGWERKSEPGTFDVQADEKPFAVRQPLLLTAAEELPFTGVPCSDGSYVLMTDISFVTD